MNLKSCFFIIFGLIYLVNLSAQTQYAKIVVYRNEPINVKEEEVFKIYADETLTTILRNNTFEEFYMPEGSFKLKVNEIYPTICKVACNIGHTYYYRINRNFSLADKPITIVSVDSLTANNELKYLKSNILKKSNVVNIDRRNSIGFVFEPGVGFEKIGILNTTVGTQVMHSFGGGVAFGLSYGYKFSDYFGWSLELSKQFSVLNPSVTNASVVFNQGVFSTTPFFTIPLIKRYKQKIKVGGGVDYRFGAVLNIETEELNNGFNDKWTYKNTFGYHVITFYEWELGTNIRMHGGFKYNDAHYSYVWSEKFIPLDPRLRTPHGNSLSVSIGCDYFF
jgi:hypothetical protein